MDYYRNPKVIGAFLVGTALVGGVYVIKNFGQPSVRPPVALTASAAEAAPNRVFIPVVDQDTDGLEDWRDQFVQAPAISVEALDGQNYEAPKTLTRQLGVSLMEGLIAAKGGGAVMRSEAQVVADLTEQIGKTATSDKIYELSDITLINSHADADIRTYGNEMASILINESAPGLESEIILLKKFVEAGEEADSTDLETVATVYKNYRDKSIATPVPRRFAKQHLDLINVYNAMYKNIDTMTKTTEDPLLPFVRLKRYEEDVQGLSLALNNLYNAIVPHAKVFEMNDPAVLLVNFNNPNL
jgi:hypothetical protein